MPKDANFTQCGALYTNDLSLIAKWNYTGPVRLIEANPKTQISFGGCKAICGTGNDWYSWSISSSFITTWVLPILGTLLQAPFQSNAFWRTVKAIGRWVGSPMASLAYILWNIEVSGKCALFVDMAIPYNGPLPNEDSDFASIRDSFYLLTNINQYKMKPFISMTKEAEGLLRIMLFSKDLKLLGSKRSLNSARRKLVKDLRSNRRRGVVPVFISALWFLFSLAISIESAFGSLGDNAQAHDLAIGLFMSWFPILILCSIVDRNPAAADEIQRKINKLLDLVCISLEDEHIRAEFIASFRDMPESQTMAYWVQKISAQAGNVRGDYFRGFSGQGRVRFHYGAAHAILIDIEKSYIANHGRNWLADERVARTSLVLGQVDHGLVWFDGRQFWQIFSGFVCVFGTGAGAFILSFFTPTVGLSCRSGGYLIFNMVALALLLSELAVWIGTSPIRFGNDQRLSNHLPVQQDGSRELHSRGLAETKEQFARLLRLIEQVVVSICVFVSRHLPLSHQAATSRKVEKRIRHHFQTLQRLTFRQWTERCFFTPLEAFNTTWLVYMIMAQATGAFNNCFCQTSVWASGGGYMDFTQWAYSNSPLVGRYWVAGTIISNTFMGIGMIYIVIEWCLQAHLSTENYKDAMNGLQNVRRFRRFTYWTRYPISLLVLATNHLMSALNVRKTSEQKTLLWTKESSYRPGIGETMLRMSTRMHQLPFDELKGEIGEEMDVEVEIMAEQGKGEV